MDTPKRKRRRKRRQQSQPPQPPQTSSNSAQLSHTADEEGGGPSTSTSSSRRKKVRSSSWSPAKKKHGSNSKENEKEKGFLIAPEHQPQLPEASARPSPLSATILIAEERDRSSTGGGSVISSSKSVGLLSVKSSSKQDADGSRTPTNGAGVAEDVFGSATTGSTNLSGKRSKKMGKKERERERVKKDLMIGKSLRKETVVGKTPSRGSEVTYEDDDDNEGDNDENDDEEDDDVSIEDNSSLNNLSLLQPPQSIRRKKGKDIAHIHNRAGIVGAYKSTPGSPKRRREFDDILVYPDDGGEHGHESLGDLDAEDNAGGGGGGGSLNVAPDEPIGKKRPSSKRRRGLVRVRSVPQLDAEEPTPCVVEETIITPGKSKSKRSKSKAAALTSTLIPAFSDGVDPPEMPQPRTKRARLIALAKELRQFFPEQRQELRRVIVRFEKQGMEPSGKGKKTFLTSDGVTVGGSIQLPAKSAPMPVPGVRKSKRGIHRRFGSESAIVDTNDDSIEGGDAAGRNGMPGLEEEEEELDPRGRPPKKGDVLIHIFIDQLSLLPKLSEMFVLTEVLNAAQIFLSVYFRI